MFVIKKRNEIFGKKIFDKINLEGAVISSIAILFTLFYSTSYAVFFTFLFLFAACLYLCIFFKCKLEYDKKTFNYAIGLYSFFFIATIIIVCRNIFEIDSVKAALLIAASAIMLMAGAGLLFLSNSLTIILSKKHLLKCLPIIIIMLLVFVMSLDSFNTYFSMDAGHYFNVFVGFNISNLNQVVPGGHFTYVWDFLVYFLYCLTGEAVISAVLYNVLCLLILVPVAYKMIKILCVDCSDLFALLCTGCLAFSTITFGLTGYFFSHIALMYAILFFLFACMINDRILMFLTSLMAIFSLETGVLITGTILFIPISIAMIRSIINKSFLDEVKRQVNVFNISEVLIHLVFTLWFLKGNWVDSGAGGLFLVQFNAELFSSLLILSNFQWLLAIVVVGALVKIILDVSLKKVTLKKLFCSNKEIMLIAAAFIPYFIFVTFTVTYNYFRYLLPVFLCLHFLFFISLHYLCKQISKERLKRVLNCSVLGGITILFIIQSYFTIDPMMLSNPRKTYMGSGNNYVVNAAYPKGSFEDWYLFDGHIYNKQVANYEIAIDRALKSIDYDVSKMIVAFDISSTWIHVNPIYYPAAISFQGWDSTKNHRYYTDDLSQRIRYKPCFIDVDVMNTLIANEYVEYWYLDFNSGFYPPVEHFVENYGVKVESSHDISYMGWRWTLSKISL